MKKALKITGIILLSLIIILIATPFLFKGKIQDAVKDMANENLNAKLEFSDVSISFIKDFPNAHISISDLKIINLKPFEGQTLLASKRIAFSMSLKELLKSEEEGPFTITSIIVDEIAINIKSDKNGNANYDIAKPTDEKETPESKFALDLKEYKINNSSFSYLDEASKIMFKISDLNHTGSAKLTNDITALNTKTEAKVSFGMDDSNFLENNPIKLDAAIDLDLKNSKYTFKKNKGFINDLPIEFDGFVQLIEEGQLIDITFENPESDFKNFLALMPKEHSKSIENVKTTGNFKVKGIIKGKSTDETIPTLDISIKSHNASFKYPDLPKSVENITIDTEIMNKTGKMEDTYVDIKALNFSIDKDVFKSSTLIKNLTGNQHITSKFNGTINLGNLTKVYPIELEEKLTGILKANINTDFDMNAVETNAYDRIKHEGSLSLTGFNYTSDMLPKPMLLSSLMMTFNNGNIAINNFKAKTGNSDISASGTITNLIGFMLNDTTLKGRFNLNSNSLTVSDFMVAEDANKTKETPNESKTSSESKTANKPEPIKIPKSLDFEINANAKSVVYDNLNLKDVKGALIIRDQKVTFKDVKSTIFDGNLGFSGEVSTQQDVPTFNIGLSAENFDIPKTYKGLELFKNLAPVAKFLQGMVNAKMSFKGKLDNEFMPDLKSLSGDAFTSLLNAKFNNEDKGAVLNKLAGTTSFVDYNKLSLKDLKANLTFADGKVTVKPFDIKYNDININVSGAHNFDNTIAYNAIFNVPAKYLGPEINNLLGTDATKTMIPITANIGGTNINPTVKTDLKSAVSNLKNQLIQNQKQKLVNTGKETAKTMVNQALTDKKINTDSIKKQSTKAVNTVVKGITGGSTTKTDSTKTNTTTKVKNALGGFLGGKKK